MYAKIAEISTTNYKGNDVAFQLFEDDATEPDPMPKFPITGYRLRFKLSDFGFGILNNTLSLDILDEDDIYYNKFNAVKRLDYAIRVTIDSNEIFWGFINFKQIERKLFQDRPNEIKITCYNPLSYLSTISITDTQAFDVFGDVVQPNVANDGRIAKVDAINCMRVGRLLTNFAFKLFNNQPDFITNLPYVCENASDFNATLQNDEKNIINAGYFSINKFIDDEGGSDSILEMLTNVMRTLFMRCGWSYSQQKPMAAATHDAGLYASEFLRYTTLKPLATNFGLVAPYMIVNNVVEYDLVGTHILEKNKFLRGATNKGINPLSVIIYKQPVPISGTAVGANVTIDENKLILNVDGVDASQGDVYESDELAFRSTPTFGGTFFIPEGDETSQNINVPGKYLGIGEIILEELLSQIHETLRNKPKERLQFVYDGILDPMINYATDFDIVIQINRFTDLVDADSGFIVATAHTSEVLTTFKDADIACPCSAGADGKLYFGTIEPRKFIITEGEYDLLLEQTIVRDSYQI